jgi:hypothetical protein
MRSTTATGSTARSSDAACAGSPNTYCTSLSCGVLPMPPGSVPSGGLIGPQAAELRASEPDRLLPADFAEDRLSLLVRRAIEAEQISLARGAEVLGLSSRDMRERAASWID